MTKSKYITLLILILWFIPKSMFPALAEPFQHFWHIPTGTNTVGTLTRDAGGTLWLGTLQGITKFDVLMIPGASREIYPEQLCQPIHHIFPTSDGDLWISTQSRQKFIYTPVTHQVTKIDSLWLKEHDIEADGDWDIRIMANGSDYVLIATAGKCYYYNVSTGKAECLNGISDGIDNWGFDQNHLHALRNGTIHSVNTTDGSVTQLDNVPGTVNGFIMMDSVGNYWVGDYELCRHDAQTGQWETLADNMIIARMVNNGDDVYIATDANGIYHYSPEGKLKKTIRHDPYDVNSLSSDHVRSIFMDSEKNLWVTYSKGGISLASPYNSETIPKHIRPLSNRNKRDDIISIDVSSDGSLLLGTDGDGIFRVEALTGKEIGTALNDVLGDRDKSITALFTDSGNRLWIGSYRNGLLCYSDGNIRRFLPSTSPYSIVEDDKGDIYVGLSGNGLYKINPRDDFKLQKIEFGGGSWVQQLFCCRGNTLLVASNDGLYSVDTRTSVSKKINGNKSGSQSLKNINIRSVYRDSRGFIWIIGSDEKDKLEIYDQQNDTILTLPDLSDVDFKSVIEDDYKNIWLAAQSSIYQIVPEYNSETGHYSFKHYIFNSKCNDRDQNSYNFRAVGKFPDGRIIFGGMNGYLIVNPSVYTELGLKMQPDVSFGLMRLTSGAFLSKLDRGDCIPVFYDISSTEEIKLPHDCNSFIIYFSERDYSSPFKADYYYQLEGLNNEWRKIDNGKIEISNLSPGTYQLNVKSSGYSGNRSETVDSIKIRIAPPWYMSTLAYIVYVLLMILCVMGLVKYFTDRSKQKLRIQQAEKEMQRQQQLNEMKLRFFTNVSHDFRTPLSLIITPLETYMSKNKDTEANEYLQPVYKNALRLLNLVNQILDFRKLEMTGVGLTRSYGDIISFVKDICQSFILFSDDSGLEFKIESEADSLFMYFDKDKVTKIMMNLLSNAFKYTPHGGTITVSMFMENDTIRISVADTGKGISDEDKKHVFDRFYQANSENSSIMGCGIGLHIVKEFVELQNGTVSIYDNMPSGVVLSFTLPIIKSLPEGETAAEDGGTVDDAICYSEDENPTKREDDASHTILLVEDNHEFINFIAKSLSADYHIIKAYNGKEALDILEKEYVNVIISDIMMDEMDGFELCRSVKNDINISHIPIILLTARTLVEDEMKGLELGADDYITKPFNMSILKQRIKKLIDETKKSHDHFKSSVDIAPSEITITSLDEEFLTNAIRIVEEHIADPEFSVETFSNLLGVHRTNLYKKLSSMTGKSPIEFIRLIRLKRAIQYLGKSQMYISEIAYKVGFNSPKRFTKYFKEEFNMLPSDYIRSLDSQSTDPLQAKDITHDESAGDS